MQPRCLVFTVRIKNGSFSLQAISLVINKFII